MPEVSFCCPLCSRPFLRGAPHIGPIPDHLDPLLGKRCVGSAMALMCWLEFPEARRAPASSLQVQTAALAH